MTIILVTGGAGAIGSRLVRRLCEEHTVYVLDDLSAGFIDNIRGLPVKFWRGSVVDDEILREVFSEPPAVVYHLAANFANQNSVDYPQKDLTVNGMGTLKLLQYAREACVERFVYTSSSCVYGNTEKPLSESMVNHNLDTPYAITKLLGEHYVNFFHHSHDLPTVIFRFFNSYGPGEYPGKYRNVIPNFIQRVMNGLPLVITGSGEETRDYTYIDDTIQALLLAKDKPEAVGGTFNVGTGMETTIVDLVRLIMETCGTQVPIEYQGRRGWDQILRRRADISHISKTLGFMPSIDLRVGLKKTFDWFIEKQADKIHLL